VKVEIRFETEDGVIRRLEKLFDTGFYGANLEETAEQLMCERLEEIEATNERIQAIQDAIRKRRGR
jgi:hypothetical protein